MTGVMIQTAFLVSAIWIVQKLLGEKLHAYVRYGLWLVVVIRLVVPINLIQSPFSLLRIADKMTAWKIQTAENISDRGGRMDAGIAGQPTDGKTESQAAEEKAELQLPYLQNYQQNDAVTPQVTDQIYAGSADIGSTETVGSDTDIQGSGGDWRFAADRLPLVLAKIMMTVRIIGSLLTGGMIMLSYIRFRRRLYRTRTVYRGDCGDVSPKHSLPVYLVKGLDSPCLVGLVRPAVYIGTEVPADSDAFRYAAIHEQVHFLHGDHLWAVLRMALVCVYWFHPFVWIAAVVSARDGEIACDYGTMRRIGQEERFAYGEMLLTFSRTNGRRRVYSYGTMLRPGKSELRERILRLTEAKSSRVWAGALSIACMVVIAGCALTGSASEDGEGQNRLTLEDSSADGTDRPEEGEEPADQNAGTDIGKGSETDGETDSTDSEGIAIAQSGNSGDDIPQEPQQVEAAVATLSEETMFGADGPILDYAGNLGTGTESVIIFHDYFGLVVYDLSNRQVVRALDLEPIGCHMTQGDNACQVAVSADGNTVWLHPGSKQYMYRYNVEENTLWQEPLVKTFNIDLEGQDLFDHYLTMEESTQKYIGWRSNYLYEEYKDEQGLQTAYIYLYVSDGAEQKLGSLKCTWDDMVFTLEWNAFNEADISAPEDVQFPYRSDGIVNEVQLIFDKPCNYTRISDTYGSRVHPITQEKIWHEGIDYAAEEGSDVYAAAGGVVYETGYSAQYGNYVVLQHMNGQMTYYCHCRDILVQKGDQAERGSTIATVGSTGMSTGPHLHFAISSFGQFVDPQEEMWEVLELQ